MERLNELNYVKNEKNENFDIDDFLEKYNLKDLKDLKIDSNIYLILKDNNLSDYVKLYILYPLLNEDKKREIYKYFEENIKIDYINTNEFLKNIDINKIIKIYNKYKDSLKDKDEKKYFESFLFLVGYDVNFYGDKKLFLEKYYSDVPEFSKIVKDIDIDDFFNEISLNFIFKTKRDDILFKISFLKNYLFEKGNDNYKLFNKYIEHNTITTSDIKDGKIYNLTKGEIYYLKDTEPGLFKKIEQFNDYITNYFLNKGIKIDPYNFFDSLIKNKLNYDEFNKAVLEYIYIENILFDDKLSSIFKLNKNKKDIITDITNLNSVFSKILNTNNYNNLDGYLKSIIKNQKELEEYKLSIKLFYEKIGNDFYNIHTNIYNKYENIMNNTEKITNNKTDDIIDNHEKKEEYDKKIRDFIKENPLLPIITYPESEGFLYKSKIIFNNNGNIEEHEIYGTSIVDLNYEIIDKYAELMGVKYFKFERLSVDEFKKKFDLDLNKPIGPDDIIHMGKVYSKYVIEKIDSIKELKDYIFGKYSDLYKKLIDDPLLGLDYLIDLKNTNPIFWEKFSKYFQIENGIFHLDDMKNIDKVSVDNFFNKKKMDLTYISVNITNFFKKLVKI